jgi:ATP-dependent DNA ligase
MRSAWPLFGGEDRVRPNASRASAYRGFASFEERRAALVRLPLCPPTSVVAETFADGAALFDAVCKLGLEGVAKRLTSRYGATQRGWIKTKNPSYWRRDSEREAMSRRHERRARRSSHVLG